MAEQKKQQTPAPAGGGVVQKQDRGRTVEYAQDKSSNGTLTVTNTRPATPGPDSNGGNKKKG